MSRGAKIVNVDPAFAIAGGEIVIDCAGFNTRDVSRCSVLIGDASAQIVALGPRRVLAVVPETTPGQVEVRLSSGDQLSAPATLTVAKNLRAIFIRLQIRHTILTMALSSLLVPDRAAKNCRSHCFASISVVTFLNTPETSRIRRALLSVLTGRCSSAAGSKEWFTK